MKRSLLLFPAVALLFILLPFSGHSEDNKEANVGDIIITTSDSHLLLFAAVKNGFTDEMMEGVRHGIPVIFTFLVELEQVKNNWPDELLAEYSILHTLSWDTLKEKYVISFSEKKTEAISTESAQKALELMAELSGFKIFQRKKLYSDARYLLNIKATLAEKTLPLNMHYIIPFISLWDLETDWRTIEFKY